MKFIVHVCFVAIMTVFILPSAAQSATQIIGTVTAKHADSVKVEFKPHKTAGPQSGDLVDFKTMIHEIEVNAGQGEVTESGSNFVWAKIKKGRPNLKTTGIIQATGKPLNIQTVLKKAYSTLKKGKNTNSLALLEKYADQGNGDAQGYLGDVYWHGYGVEENDTKAVQLFRLAIAQGHIGSQYNLGKAYLRGIGVEQNLTKAMQLLKSSADQGHAKGQAWTGYCYVLGKGTAKDCEKGLYYLKLGVKAEDSTAINILARFYTDGECADKDLNKGLALLKRAVDEGQVYAMANLAQYYEKGWVVEKDIEKAIYWYKKSGTTWAKEALDRLGAAH